MVTTENYHQPAGVGCSGHLDLSSVTQKEQITELPVPIYVAIISRVWQNKISWHQCQLSHGHFWANCRILQNSVFLRVSRRDFRVWTQGHWNVKGSTAFRTRRRAARRDVRGKAWPGPFQSVDTVSEAGLNLFPKAALLKKLMCTEIIWESYYNADSVSVGLGFRTCCFAFTTSPQVRPKLRIRERPGQQALNETGTHFLVCKLLVPPPSTTYTPASETVPS